MKLTDKQAHMLYQIAMDSLVIVTAAPFCFDVDTRRKLVQSILDQQDNTMRELGTREAKKGES